MPPVTLAAPLLTSMPQTNSAMPAAQQPLTLRPLPLPASTAHPLVHHALVQQSLNAHPASVQPPPLTSAAQPASLHAQPVQSP